jgi:hypothetical protein
VNNKIYVLIYESYIYDANSFTIEELKLFSTIEGAKEYMKALIDVVIDNALRDNDLTMDDLVDEHYPVYNYVTRQTYFYLDIADYGYDTIYIKEREILNFIN